MQIGERKKVAFHFVKVFYFAPVYRVQAAQCDSWKRKAVGDPHIDTGEKRMLVVFGEEIEDWDEESEDHPNDGHSPDNPEKNQKKTPKEWIDFVINKIMRK